MSCIVICRAVSKGGSTRCGEKALFNFCPPGQKPEKTRAFSLLEMIQYSPATFAYSV